MMSMVERSMSGKLSDTARRRFKEAMRAGRIKAGAFVSQAELASLVGVPLGALRDAMQVLEHEGFLTIMPRSGIQIVKADMELLRNAFQLRRMIELEGARKMVELAPAEELASWTQRHAAILARARADERDGQVTGEAIALDGAFHDQLVAQLRNPLILDDYQRTMDLLNIIRIDSIAAVQHYAVDSSMVEHLEILAAMTARDLGESVRRLERHLAQAMHRAMGL
jgi:DNA-binding GntR family transcriptional regulator